MKFSDVQRVFSRLQKLRILVDRQERRLQVTVSTFLEEREHGAPASRVLGVSAAYAHDIRHGRRKISEAIIDRLAKLA